MLQTVTSPNDLLSVSLSASFLLIISLYLHYLQPFSLGHANTQHSPCLCTNVVDHELQPSKNNRPNLKGERRLENIEPRPKIDKNSIFGPLSKWREWLRCWFYVRSVLALFPTPQPCSDHFVHYSAVGIQATERTMHFWNNGTLAPCQLDYAPAKRSPCCGLGILGCAWCAATPRCTLVTLCCFSSRQHERTHTHGDTYLQLEILCTRYDKICWKQNTEEKKTHTHTVSIFK